MITRVTFKARLALKMQLQQPLLLITDEAQDNLDII